MTSFVALVNRLYELLKCNGGGTVAGRYTFVMNSIDFHQLARGTNMPATLPAMIFGCSITIDNTATDITMKEIPDEYRRGGGTGIRGSAPASTGAGAYTYAAGTSIHAGGGSVYPSPNPGVRYRLIRPDGTVIVEGKGPLVLADFRDRYAPPWLYQQKLSDTVWVTRAQSSPIRVEGAYRAWRAWYIDRSSLWSVAVNYGWTPGWNESQIIENRSGYSSGYPYALGYDPLRDGSGGFYGLHTFNDLLRQVPVVSLDPVLGTMVACGRMRKGTRGIRATRAKVEAIVLTGNLDRDAELLAIADRYGARCIANYDAARKLPTGLFDYHDGD